MDSLTDALKQQAHRLGFQLAGVCRAVETPNYHRFQQWLEAGFAGRMRYLPDRRQAYRHPDHVLQGVRSILMLGMNYRQPPAANQADQAAGGRVAGYARGNVDYHDLIQDRLRLLVQFLRDRRPRAQARGVVDTAPLLEREFARLAGIGWIGKNTLLLNRDQGSLFFLAALLTDELLDEDPPYQTDHCGTCRACLDACPTAAFPQPYVLDATRCISYLTIELKSSIPEPLRPSIGDWLFGCDICQDVCPWNLKVQPTEEAQLQSQENLDPVDLVGLFQLDERAFRARFRATALWRAKRRGLLRNAAIVLGNLRPPRGLEALQRGLNDSEPLVRAASAWAVGRYESAAARAMLVDRLRRECDDEVRTALQQAVAKCEANQK